MIVSLSLTIKPTLYCVILLKCDSFWFRRDNEICPIVICSLCCAVDWLQFAQHFVFTGNGTTAEHGKPLMSRFLINVKHSRVETNVCGCTIVRAKNGIYVCTSGKVHTQSEMECILNNF